MPSPRQVSPLETGQMPGRMRSNGSLSTCLHRPESLFNSCQRSARIVKARSVQAYSPPAFYARSSRNYRLACASGSRPNGIPSLPAAEATALRCSRDVPPTLTINSPASRGNRDACFCRRQSSQARDRVATYSGLRARELVACSGGAQILKRARRVLELKQLGISGEEW